MYQLVQDNKDINVTTLVELKRLGIEINQVNAAQLKIMLMTNRLLQLLWIV